MSIKAPSTSKPTPGLKSSQPASPSGLMLQPGTKPSKEVQDWYRRNLPFDYGPREQPKPKTTAYRTQEQTRANNPYYRAPDQPNYITAEASEARQNNIMGAGIQAADERYQTKQLDKAGFSRGAGQRHQGATNSARTLHDAARDANKARADDQQLNNTLRREYNDEVERRTQYAEGMRQQLAQSDWQRQFEENQLNAQLFMQYNKSLTDILNSLTN